MIYKENTKNVIFELLTMRRKETEFVGYLFSHHQKWLKLQEDVCILIIVIHARMAKLADALASGASDRKVLGVQVPLRALKKPRIARFFFLFYSHYNIVF
jgi:hypothetical protein